MFSSVSVTFPYGVPVQVWFFIVSIPGHLCLPLYSYTGVSTKSSLSVFFKYLIYDIVNCKYFLISLFVDDTRLFCMVDDPVSLAKRHNSDIVDILQ